MDTHKSNFHGIGSAYVHTYVCSYIKQTNIRSKIVTLNNNNKDTSLYVRTYVYTNVNNDETELSKYPMT